MAPGRRIGRFVVEEELGSGGMGVVVGARDPDLGRRVAIKLLHPERVHAAREAETRLLREAQALATLSHPNVVTVHEVGTHAGHVYIAMEFVAGDTLRTRLENVFDWTTVVSLFQAAGRGLASAHSAGLVHRDFKPENVLVGFDGRVRVTDFGLVSVHSGLPAAARTGAPAPIGGWSGPLTETGAILGTPAYMSPEQHRGETVDERSDQFSFCAALYEALFGLRPFEGKAYEELAANILSNALRPPPRNTGVPGALRRLVLRGLSHDPAERFSSMEELLTELAATLPSRRPKLKWAAACAALALCGVSLGHAAVTVSKRNAELDRAVEQIASLKRVNRTLAWERDLLEQRHRHLEETLGTVLADQVAEAQIEAEQDTLEATMELERERFASANRRRRAPVKSERQLLELPSRRAARTPGLAGEDRVSAALARLEPEVNRCAIPADLDGRRSYDDWATISLSRYTGRIRIVATVSATGLIVNATVRDGPEAVRQCVGEALTGERLPATGDESTVEHSYFVSTPADEPSR